MTFEQYLLKNKSKIQIKNGYWIIIINDTKTYKGKNLELLKIKILKNLK